MCPFDNFSILIAPAWHTHFKNSYILIFFNLMIDYLFVLMYIGILLTFLCVINMIFQQANMLVCAY